MPNWCENTMVITAKSRGDLDDFFDKYGLKVSDDTEVCGFDFGKIIPEPKTKEECPEDCIATANSAIEIDKDRPWFNWWNWRWTYWGVKWNASNVVIERDGCVATIYYSTPWNPPKPVIKALKEQNRKLSFRNTYKIY